ncbi:MAG TPA: FAD:protein FMN transferase, partial [Vicinamibacterales bacterium]
CTRFDPGSELRQLAQRVGEPVPASPIVFEAVRFALAVAEDTAGAFDPTAGGDANAGYSDITIDAQARTILLHRPLTIDLGAVAKGLAVDAAARELRSFHDFAIDAGGDLYLGGRNSARQPWTVGVRHPREEGLVDSLRVSDAAVCTSGDYERPDHIITRHHRRSGAEVVSVTVVAPAAMLADALGTAAFVLGPEKGLRLFARHDVEGLIITSSLERFETPGLPRA